MVMLNRLSSIMIVISIVLIIIGSILLFQGFDKKDNYYQSEYASYLNKHVYVGGDAYNYIINGTYFIGYITLATASYVISILLVCTASIIKILIYKSRCES
jgi:hypothetical protein